MTLKVSQQSLQHRAEDREVLIKVDNVSKRFCRDLKKSLWYGVQDIASEVIGRKYEHTLRPEEFWAVKDVSFELRRGECLGLIGHNGAGKTTLLKMLNGLIKPDRGSIEMNGRVGALIALGTGFNPILTGRENIYVNASILGISKKEIDAKMDEIIEFSEIGDFIDAPVQSYSSGMTVRLGFAVASRLNPDILIVDEVLAVGDISFKIKCYNEIHRLVKNAAVVFVSHSMPQVAKLCNQCLVMDRGQKKMLTSNVPEGIDCYNQMVQFLGMTSMGDGRAQVKKLRITSNRGASEEVDFENPTPKRICFSYQDTFNLTLILEVDRSVKAIRPQINFFNVEQHIVAQCSPTIDFRNEGTQFSINLTIEKLLLNRGIYSLGLAIYEPDTHVEKILSAFRDVITIDVSNSVNLGAAPIHFMGDWRKSR